MSVALRACGLFLLSVLTCGCQQPGAQQQAGVWGQQTQPYLAQMQELNQRALSFDADNRDLHTSVAKLNQQLQLKNDELTLLRERMSEMANQMRDLQLADNQKAQQIDAFNTAATRGGGASITANNSLQNALKPISLAGIDVRQDGDVIRIELPTDQLFQQGTATLTPQAYPLIDQVADAVNRAYPDQVIGVEGHSDTALLGSTTNHRLAAAQALAVFDVLSQRNRIPESRLNAASYGANYPRADNASAAGRARNRRIEVVIYPDQASR